MASTRELFTTSSHGMTCTHQFNGLSGIRDIDTATISHILVAHQDYLNSLTVLHRGETSGIKFGAAGGTVTDIILEPGEYITRIQGNVVGSCISSVRFYNNKGRHWGPYGTRTGSLFEWNGSSFGGADLGPQMGLLYLSGSYGPDAISLLTATFGRYTPYPSLTCPPEVVVYEEEAQALDSGVPSGLSRFAQTLMSPIATLHVGPNDIVFRTNEDTLCRLPFFRAALKGEFVEAFEKTIKMPEDEPEVVSALIQFLYDDRYTYTYKPVGMTNNDQKDQKNQKNPPIELREGLFHAHVYALANKYDCQGLVDAAKKSLKYVLKGLKGIDILHFLKETYDKGWTVAQWEEDSDMKEFRQGLPVLLKQLFLSNREELELIVSECPAVGYDLMRLLVFT